ncbi:phage tail protein [Halomonas sp. OfavH-34-E]|uniref:phage tail-collar fiber domain-containing protein n=1 Tax=Halomonas sp. OfavH-34-E TaxID=2954491 RepID=UPI002097F706|nr:phage tail protein [Halomonas sp. OfavH-34-E]MCO7217126.1 phage tail protein [Halomonas sp. OfavH-34-E]
MAQKFYTRLTQIGQAKYANAVGVGEQVEFVQLVVGDGGGQELTPEQVQQRETMVNQVRVGPINQVYKDADNPNWLVMEQVLPPDVGGWTIREVGVIDADGDLVAYGNYPATYKPVLEEGSSRTSTVRFVLMVSDTSVVTLKVDPSVVLATRKYVDDEIGKHEQSRNHPSATTTAQGMVEKATVTEARSGEANKFPDAAGVLEAINQFGIGKDRLATNRSFDFNGNYPPGSCHFVDIETADNAPDVFSGFYYAYVHIPSKRDQDGDNPMVVYAYGSSSVDTRMFFRTGANKTASPFVEVLSSENVSDFVGPMIAEARSGDQFSPYDSERVYSTGEITRGADGKFYEFYDRDQFGTVQGVDPTNIANRPHVWMEWHGVRPGTVIEWRSTTLPEGYVENDGAAIGRSAYRRIFAAYGTSHGAGDGSTTFNLPDDRGEFKRGWDHGRGVDPSRNLASWQKATIVGGYDDNLAASNSTLYNLNEVDYGSDGFDIGDYPGAVMKYSSLTDERDSTSYSRFLTATRPRNNAVIYLTKI